MTGVDAVYKKPVNPNMVITEQMTYEESVKTITDFILSVMK